jgi:metal-responsive CopG/Arc/MetJ family transcriptional regulator
MGSKMVRTKVGITLTEDTLKRLEEIAEQMGLSKSQAISMLINNEYLSKYQSEDKIFKA